MLKWLKKLFQKNDPTAYNCDVYINLKTSELIVVNSRGELEGDVANQLIQPESNEEYEYLGDL